ncbi:MAG: hypothetical protein IJY12_01795 [Clostridia bacterium]|nr:hypothetical protein [Clostridia bacterium]
MKDKTKLKKRILIGILVLVILAAGAYIYTLLAEEEPSEELLAAEAYLYRYDTPADYDSVYIDTETDIYSYEPYLACDRSFYYRSGNTTTGYTMEEARAQGGGVAMLADYLESLMNADFEAHAAFFSDEEYFSSSIPSRFSRQMVYNVEVEYLGTYETTVFYRVRFAILESDGTYFLHMKEGAQRELWYALECVEDEYKIKAIYNSSLAIYAIVNGT